MRSSISHSLFLIFTLWASPTMAQVTSDVAGLALSATDPRIIAAKIIRVALGFLGTVALLLVLYGGYLWMTAAGNDEQIDKAKKVLTQAVIGLVIILSAFAITQFVISRLIDATRGPSAVVVSGFGGPGSGLPPDAFFVRSIDPKGVVPIRNVVAQVVFNRPPTTDPANLAENVVLAQKDTGARVEVVYTVSGSTIELEPKTACPSPNEQRKCFDADTEFTVEVKVGLVSASGRTLTCGGLAPNCTGTFRTGNLIDTAPPSVEITAPDPGTGVPVETCVPVQARVKDDAGIRRVEFYADGILIEDGTVAPQGSSSPQEALLEISCWPTTAPAPKAHKLKAKAFDIDTNSATSAEIEVIVRPFHCFNGAKDDSETAIDCEISADGPSGCGLCTGAPCSQNNQCASGACVNSQCITPTVITGISPGDGRAGTFVTVAGHGLGTTPGTVRFSENVLAVAPQACAGVTTWSDNYALVGVPEGAVTGPVTIATTNCPADNALCRDTTDDARGPIIPTDQAGAFEVNEVAHPGLCAVNSPPENLAQGGWGTRVDLRGVQFGSAPGQGNVFFGAAAGAGLANWSDTGATTAVPAVGYGAVSVQVVDNQGTPSNSLPYQVLSPDASTLPEILSVTPSSGGPGTGISLVGRNFGAQVGSVYFIAADGTATLADTSVPIQCGTTWWTPQTIAVKVPAGLVVGSFQIYVHRYDGQQSNQVGFGVNNTPSGPFLACLRPLGGPLLSNVSVYGENLGALPIGPRGLYFTRQDSGSALAFTASGAVNPDWASVRASPTTIGGVVSDGCPAGGWSPNEICAQVPNDQSSGAVAGSGQVLVEQDLDGVTRRSNPLAFAVGNCTAPSGSPLHLDCGELTCCGDGTCNSVCPIAVSPISAYGWQFSTAPAPVIPEVVVQCDQEIGPNDPPEYPPSPSPSAASGRGSDAEICVNAQVVITLSTPVLPATLNANNLKIEKCTGAENLITGANAAFDNDTSVWTRPEAPDISGAPAHADLLAVARVAGLGHGTDPDDAGNFALRLTKLDDDTGPGWLNATGIQQNYEHWFGYEASVIVDTLGRTYTASAWMKAGDVAAVGRRAGILIQRNGGNWQKVTQEITLTNEWQVVSATITFDSVSSEAGFIRVFAEGAPYDIRVPEPAPDPAGLFSVMVDDVQVVGDPCTQVEANQFASGYLDPAFENRGFNWWPLQNFEVDSWYRVTLLGGAGGIKATGERGQEMAVRPDAQVACGYSNAAYCFRFKTKNAPLTADNLCEVGGIAVTPSPFTARAENERIDYRAIPVALGDPCIAPRPDSYGWVWSSADSDKAIVSYTPERLGHACGSEADCAIGHNVCSNAATQACMSSADCAEGGTCTPQEACVSGYCRFMGWTTTTIALNETDSPPGYVGINASVKEVSGQGQLAIEFGPAKIVSYFPSCGEACRNAALGAEFSKVMRADATDADAVTNSANVQVWAVPCGNGTVEDGEDCDDGNTLSGDGCSAVCLHEGSNYLLRCGNGAINTFEDCDDGNTAAGDGCSTTCLHEGTSTTCGNSALDALEDCDDGNLQNGDSCSGACLNEGTRADLAICGNRRLDRGEECEANFDGSFADWCDTQTCLRQGPAEAARCENGRIDPGEECDPNSALLNTSAKKTLCNSQCQWTGTLRPGTPGGQGCGNGQIEIGEDCDDGNLRPGDACDSNCRNEGSAPGTIPACGNSVIDRGEDCDDGNVLDNDGCSAPCLNEGRPGASCGNNTLDLGEDCERALLPQETRQVICSADCRNLGTDAVIPATGQDTARPNVCGNGEVNDGEDCDGGLYCTANCLHVSGRPPEQLPSSFFTLGWDVLRKELTAEPHAPLAAQTLYRVLLRGDDPATPVIEGMRACRGPDCASGKALIDDPETPERELNYYFNWNVFLAPNTQGGACTPDICNTFSWTFKTGDSVCGIAKVELAPPEASLYVIGGRQPYSASPMSAPDTCNPQGERLNPFAYHWGWDTQAVSPVVAHDIATIVNEVTDDENPSAAPFGVDRIPSCGNGRVDYGEDCDDGNAVSGDGCSGADAAAPCTREGSGFAFACGNGRLDPGEECDNPDNLLCGYSCLRLGNTACAGGSASNCCGNGVAEDGRQGRPQFGEDCDDGNTLPGDGCSPRCLNEGTSVQTGQCGNGGIDRGEECDPLSAGFAEVVLDGQVGQVALPGLLCNPETCLLRGTLPYAKCNNAPNPVLQAGEECEDGNVQSGDGCSAQCLREGTTAAPPGNCGNGRLNPYEDCDDGNSVSGDGCSNRCLNEGTVLEIGATAKIDPYQQVVARGIAKFCRPISGAFPPESERQWCREDEECAAEEICVAPNPWTTIAVTAAAQGKTGEAGLTVFCLAASDRDCPVPGGGSSDTIGRGTDSCCYLRPQVALRTPTPGAGNVCRNAFLQAVFNQPLDPESLTGNFIIARRAPGGACAPGEQELNGQGNLVNVPAVPSAQAPGLFRRLLQRLFGWLGPVVPGAQAQPTVWCVTPELTVAPTVYNAVVAGAPVGAVTLRPSKLLGSADTEVGYRIAIVGDRNIDDAQVSGVRSRAGVGLHAGDFGVDLTWEFTAGRDICTLDEVEVLGGTSFEAADESVSTQAAAYTNARVPRQQIYPTNGYGWAWSWGSSDPQVATVTNTPNTAGAILSDQLVTAGTKKGTAQVNATATIIENTVSGVTGVSVVGSAEFSTLFCDNPWPQDPATLYRLADTEAQPLSGERATNFATGYCRDGSPVLPELRYPPAVLTPPVVSGAQNSQTLKEILLTAQMFSEDTSAAAYVQTPNGHDAQENGSFSYAFNFPEDGDYELTVETSNWNHNSDDKDDELSNLAAVLEANAVPEAVRNVLRDSGDAERMSGAYYHRLRVVLDNVDYGEIRAKAVASSAPHSVSSVLLQGITKGSHTVVLDWQNNERLPSADISVDGELLAAGSIWDANLRVHKLTLKKGRIKDDAIGIRIMSNPERLAIRDWYAAQAFGGQPTDYPTLIDGYEAIKDGNTIYIGAVNAGAPLAEGSRVVYGNIYIVSLSENAKPEIKAIYGQLIANLTFNVNVENLKTCAPECSSEGVCAPQKLCSKDLDCATGATVICRADKDKLARDLIRMNHIGTITAVLADYKGRTGTYPTLPAGTFIRAMSTSKWPSWGATLSSALGVALPQDPINLFGADCVSAPGEQGSYDQSTCWNETAQSYRCPPGSHLYQYEAQGGAGYKLKTEFELLERPRPAGSTPLWDVFGWAPLDTEQVAVLTSGLCGVGQWSNSASSCGNRVIEAGEACEIGTIEERIVPLAYDDGFAVLRCSGDPLRECLASSPCPVGSGLCIAMTSCIAERSCRGDCQGWNPWLSGSDATVADCRPGGTFCGNGVRDNYSGDEGLDETCDDGLLNGQYGKCNTLCTGLGFYYCGDGTRNGPETCDEGVLNGQYGYCRFDCSGIGEQCGDGQVNGTEQCEGESIQRVAGRCLSSTGTLLDQQCDTLADCAGLSAVGCAKCTAEIGTGYARTYERSCAPSCTWASWSGCVTQARCGNGTTEGDEECDDGNDSNEDGCLRDCTHARCGDGKNQEKVCTAGPADQRGYACTTNAQCGQGGVCQDSEECDLGAQNGEACTAPYNGVCTSCDHTCNIVTASGGFCGDTIWQTPPEQCEGAQGFVSATGAPTWVCQGTVGGSERFWNFETDAELAEWSTSTTSSATSLGRIEDGYNSRYGLQFLATADNGQVRRTFPNTDGVAYVLSGWFNTSTYGGSKVKLQMDRVDVSDTITETTWLTLDDSLATWQYLELTKVFDSGPNRLATGRIRIVTDVDGNSIRVDQVHLRPASPVCTSTACARQCRGGILCQNILKRCEGGTAPGVACQKNSNCAGGGTCVHNNFDRSAKGSSGGVSYFNPVSTVDNGEYVGDLISDTCDNDDDNDGFPAGTGTGYDCDDHNALVHPDTPTPTCLAG